MVRHTFIFALDFAIVLTLLTCGSLFADESAPPADRQTAAQQASATETASAERPAPSAEQIAAWIAGLDSNRYRVREQATQQLRAAGVAAGDALLAAANSGRPEPADRAVWILRQLGKSDDYEVAVAALDRLVDVKDRPGVTEGARRARERIHELICQQKLAKLGGRLTIVDHLDVVYGRIKVVHVELGDEWHGTPDDFQCLAALRQHRFFRLNGPAIGDAEVRLFEAMDELMSLQLFHTRVTPVAVDAIKERQPEAVVYVRNQALLGIEGGNHPRGVFVKRVQDGTAAAVAGIAAADVITKLADKPVQDFDRLTAQIAQHRPGEQIEVAILRGDEQLTKRVTLGSWPDVK